MKVHAWGRLQTLEHEGLPLSDRQQVKTILTKSTKSTKPGLPFGMGRSYGDVCLNPGGVLWLTQSLDRFLSFDDQTGVLVCEAGVLLDDIQRTFVARGWMLPVTPGTRFVTVGGAVANDVHGKNHHRMGTFGEHVLALTLVRTTGDVIACGRDCRSDWMSATIGGMGLTGLIQTVTLQLRRVPGPWLQTETVVFDDLTGFFEHADASEADWEYTVAWIDCLAGHHGRGVFLRANHALSPNSAREPARRRTVRMPSTPPVSLVNGWSLRAFNAFYYYSNRYRQAARMSHYESFFYPLDHVQEWNRMYGPHGFYQYQCVVPTESGQDVVRELLREIAHSRQGSFLAVLKTFGNRFSRGMLSFPMPGVTLALDFPDRGEVTSRLFQRMDDVVRTAGGRLYTAKDARMPRALFEAGYPRLDEFMPYRDAGISSAMSRRLMGH